MKKLLLAFGLLCTALHLHAVSPFPYTEVVGFSCQLTATGTGVGGGGSMTIYDEGSSPNVGSSANWGESGVSMAWVRPGKQYTVSYSATVAGSPATGGSYLLSFVAPKGYTLLIDGVQTDLYYRSFSTPTNPTYVSDSHTIELRPLADYSPAAAGSFSGINLGKSVGWEVGLGGLRTGQSAGRIIFKEFDLTNSPASRDRLYFTAPANYGQITTVMDGSSGLTLRQLSVPQTVVDLVDDAGGGYWFKFYTPAQATWTGSIYTFTGQTPWRTIRVESPGTSQLKITETEGSAVRVSTLVLTSGTVSSGTYLWTLQEGDGSTWLRTTTHTSTNNGGTPATRDDIAVVRTLGTSGTIVAKTKYHYVTQSWGEEVTQLIADPDTAALTTTYAYYTTSSAYGNYRQIQSVTGPTGKWVSYLYYDDWNRRGQVQTETRPYVDTPGTVQSADITVGNSVSHDYAADFSGRYRLESSADNYTTNVPTGKTRTTPTLFQTRNSLYYTVAQTDNYSSSGSCLRTISEVIDPVGGSSTDYSFLPYAVKRPDQSQDSYAYYLGTYSGTTFTVSGSGTCFRTNVWHGSTSTSGADSFTSYGGSTVTTVNLVPNQSTMDVTIRDATGLVLRTETHVYTGSGAFSLMTSEDFTYDGAGRLTQRVASNGAITTNTITNGRLTSTVDPAGTETRFTYDSLGRVSITKKAGASTSGTYTAQVDLTTTYTYDGANHATQTLLQNPSGSPALTLANTATYDLAGRPTQQVQYSGSSNSLTTGYAYSSGGKIVTATLPGSATKITEAYLDGQVKSITGTAVVNEFMSYAVASGTGNCSGAHRFSSTSSPTITTTTNDWLGRKITFVQPGWNGSNTTQSWYYNTYGQLYKMSQPGLADTLYVYDTLGGLVREGLDIGSTSGSLDLASDDRITDHAWTFFSSSSNWWRRETASTYATASSSTATQTGKVETQLSGFSAAASGYTRLARADRYDVFGNVTTTYTEVKIADKMAVTTTVTPDSTTNAVQIAYNGLLVSATDTVGFNLKYGYDNLGRQNTSVDPRTGTTTTAYIAGTSLVYTVTDPASVAQATYTYDSAGRATSVKNGLTKFAYYDYNARNQKTREWGQSTYPVEYYYDAYGRQTAMRTFANNSEGKSGGSEIDFTGSTWPSAAGTDLNDNPSTPPAKGDRTLWAFQEATGLLSSKTDANSKSVSYAYTQARQIYTRDWARIYSGTTRVNTTYGYSSTTGELTSVTYNDGTTNLAYTYNRLGQSDTVADCTGSRTFAYNLSGTLELQSETLAASFYGGRRLGYYYDTTGTGTKGRPVLFGLGTSSFAPNSYQFQNYAYQTTDGRLSYSGVYSDLNTGIAQGFTFGYLPNSHLLNQVNDSTANYTDLRGYDTTHDWTASRTTSIGSAPKAAFAYTPDTLGRINSVAKTGELFNSYGNGSEGLNTTFGYDDRSQLTSDVTTVGISSTVLSGRNDGYAFDNLGNRNTATHNSITATYTPNALNQYSQRTASTGVVDVAGAAASTATVYTNGMGPTRQGGYFFQNFLITGSSAQSFNSVYGVTSQVKSLNGIYGFNWQNQPVTTPAVTGPTGVAVTVLEFDGSPWHVGMDVPQFNYTFQNGHTYTFGFWARTVSGTRSITPMMTDNGNTGITSSTYNLDTNWKWVTVTKSYSTLGGSPRLFYNWDGGGVPFQVYAAQVADITDPQYAGLLPSYVPATPQAYSYDADGNLTDDGLWTYLYDAENRLIWMQTSGSAPANVPITALRLYNDHLGRRACKINYAWNGATWVQGTYESYVYRGWNLIQTMPSAGPNKNYYWGLDLSGTEQGAGGVGGLLAAQEGGQTYLPMYDGNGNVYGMITAAAATLGGANYPAGSIVAAYEYDAFGKVLRESGPYAASNPWQYSTKFTDIETGLVCYGLRYYNPTVGRFLNPDPIQEAGGNNLYGFCGNNGVNGYDYLGMDPPTTTETRPQWVLSMIQSLAQTVGDYMRGYGSSFVNPDNAMYLSGQNAMGVGAVEGDSQAQAIALSAAGANADYAAKHPNSGGTTTGSGSNGGHEGKDAEGNPIWILDPYTSTLTKDATNSAGNGVGGAINQGILDFQKGVTGFGPGNVNSPSGQLGKGTGLAMIAVPAVELFNAARGLLVARVAAAAILPDGMGIGIVQNGRVLIADLTVSTSHQALAAQAGVLGADGTLIGGAQAITWTVENGVIRTTASINFPSQTSAATEQIVNQYLQALAKANGGG